MSPSLRRLSAIGLALMLGLGAGVCGATARTHQTTQATKGGETRQPTRVRILPSPSQESASQRERRLRQECRGRPNAGACLGYAS